MIGTTAALITMAAATAGAQTAGAVMQNRAAGKASKAQQAATQDSQRVAQQVYQSQNEMMNPFRVAGTQSANLLGSLMLPNGAPGGYQPGMPVGAPPMPQPQSPFGQAMGQRPMPPQPPRPPMGGPPQMGPGGPPPNPFMSAAAMGPRPQGPPMPMQPQWGQPNPFMPRY